MPVTSADLSLKRAESNTDTSSTNGGHLTSTAMGTTLFPDVSGTERTAGLTRWRKVYLKNEAGTGTAPEKVYDPLLGLIDARIFLLNTSASEDYFLVKAAVSKTGVQSAETDTGWCGTGVLDSDIAISEVTLDVETEIAGSAGELFQNGGTVLITDGTNREFVTLTSVSYVSNVYTLGFTGSPLQHDYTAKISSGGAADIYTSTTIGLSTASYPDCANKRIRLTAGTGAGQIRRITSNDTTTFTVAYAFDPIPDGTTEYEVFNTQVCMCAELGDIECSHDTAVVVTADSGTFDDSYITLYPIGCIDEEWTLIFSDANNFSIVGSRVTSPGSFTISGPIKPNNGASYYFDIDPAAFGGTFTNGDTVTFNTVSASAAAWIKETVVAGTTPHLANSVDVGISGDTV